MKRIEGLLRQAALVASSSRSSRQAGMALQGGGFGGRNRHEVKTVAPSQSPMKKDRTQEERERVMHWVVRCWRSNDGAEVRGVERRAIEQEAGAPSMPRLGEEELQDSRSDVQEAANEQGTRHWNEYVVDALLNDLHDQSSQAAVVLQVGSLAPPSLCLVPCALRLAPSQREQHRRAASSCS